MKKVVIFLSYLFLISNHINAQKSYSIDAGYIKSVKNHLDGANLSFFYHFNEKATLGLELNRFFAAVKSFEGKEVTKSAWDFDLNFHYYVPLYKRLHFYPILGVSHTTEKIVDSGVADIEDFFSFNTGGGIKLLGGKWQPAVEYLFTWGKLNQQFFLVGVGYEFECKKNHGK